MLNTYKDFDCVVVHYDEIGLKGSNRLEFEKRLMRNIKRKLGSLFGSCRRETGMFALFPVKDADYSLVEDVLSKVPGIAYFSFAKKASRDISMLSKEVVAFVEHSGDFETFRIYARRHDKDYPMKSPEINSILGGAVVEAFHKKAKMKNADLIVKVEVSFRDVYISASNMKSVGGLPSDQRQKVVSLLSGGFDSPVASYMMMKRGCEVILVHFQNQGQMSCSVEDKITRIANELSKYQIRTKLYIVPFEMFQKQIIMNARAEIRMLVYRRFMLKISSKIASLNHAKFLVVGDSLSQVASQTFENLSATYESSDMHILSPLIGMNKTEIIDISKSIGTYDISKLPYGDCCSYFLPKHPVLKAEKRELDEIESLFENVDELVENTIKGARVLEY